MSMSSPPGPLFYSDVRCPMPDVRCPMSDVDVSDVRILSTRILYDNVPMPDVDEDP